MVQKIDPLNNGNRESNLSSNNDSEKDEFLMDIDPFLLFINSIRAEETKKKYLDRLKYFFDYLSIPGESIDERCRLFIQNCNNNPKYAINCAFKFILHQRQKVEKKEIVVSTLQNYLKPIKKLCVINDININWKKLTSGLPKERKYADDRSPTKEEMSL